MVGPWRRRTAVAVVGSGVLHGHWSWRRRFVALAVSCVALLLLLLRLMLLWWWWWWLMGEHGGCLFWLGMSSKTRESSAWCLPFVLVHPSCLLLAATSETDIETDVAHTLKPNLDLDSNSRWKGVRVPRISPVVRHASAQCLL